MNPVDAFAVSQRLLLCHLPAVAYHRIYINPVVVSRASDLPWFSNRRQMRFYGTICLLYGIELRGDGGTNGSHESRGLKLAESCLERIEKPEGWVDGSGGGVDVGNHGGRFGTRGGGFLRGLERNARPKRRRHLARHHLFQKCALGVLYLVTGVRSRNAPAQ